MEGAKLRRARERLLPYATIVFDLDGTLVRLDVDWRRAQAAMALAARRFGQAYEDQTVWAMLRETAGEEREALDGVLREYEIEGARRAHRLPMAELPSRLTGIRVGVVTLNCRTCAEEALRATGLDAYVHAIVAREDTARLKPDPEPLLLCIGRLHGEPEEAVFVGDQERDRETAGAAGTAFLAVQDLLG